MLCPESWGKAKAEDRFANIAWEIAAFAFSHLQHVAEEGMGEKKPNSSDSSYKTKLGKCTFGVETGVGGVNLPCFHYSPE